MLGSPGALRVSLIARPLHRTFPTLLARQIIQPLGPRIADSALVTWTAAATALPIPSDDALRRPEKPDTVWATTKATAPSPSPGRRRATAAGARCKEKKMADRDLEAKDVIEALDSFYCHNVVVGLWADAVANRLEGMAIYLLSDELPEVADHARAAARRLADRIGDLSGAITGDPRQLIDRAPGDNEFTIPNCSDPRAIISYALHRLEVIITAYQDFLDKVRGRDDVSFALVVDLLAAETHRRADAQAALAGQ